MRFSKFLRTALVAGIILPMTMAVAMAERAWTTAELNVRAGPGVRHQVIDVLKRDKAVNVRTCNRAGWCYIGYNRGNRRGWVSGRYLSYGGAPVVRRRPPQTTVIVPVPVPRRVYRPRPPRYYYPYYGPPRHFRPRSRAWR